jgi:hypothetical protein
MACGRRVSLRSRLAGLEHRAGNARGQNRPRVVVWLPRKDDDHRPPGAYPLWDGVLAVLYEADQPAPELPAGWRERPDPDGRR